jgi:hypothetical protein
MYLLLEMVGASVSLLMEKTAPRLLSYLRLVPTATVKKLLAPLRKSMSTTLEPTALGLGQSIERFGQPRNAKHTKQVSVPRGWGDSPFLVGSHAVNVCAETSEVARATVRNLESILRDVESNVSVCRVWVGWR